MEIHRAIRAYRTRAGLTQRALAAAVGVSQGMVSQWETGRAYPELGKISQLAAVLGVSEQALVAGGVDEAGDAETAAAPEGPATPYLQSLEQAVSQAGSLERLALQAQTMSSVPLVPLGHAPAGSLADDELVGYRVEVPATLLAEHPAAQAALVEGDDMDRVAPEGAIVVFDPDLPPRNGRIAIVETEDQQVLIRRWLQGNTTVTLYADSHQLYPDIVVGEGAEGTEGTTIRVLGTVVKVIVPDSLL